MSLKGKLAILIKLQNSRHTPRDLLRQQQRLQKQLIALFGIQARQISIGLQYSSPASSSLPPVSNEGIVKF